MFSKFGTTFFQPAFPFSARMISGGTAYRLAWSTLGDQLVLVNTAVEGISTITLCDREELEKGQREFIGHSGTVIAARAGPVVLMDKDSADDVTAVVSFHISHCTNVDTC